MSCFDDKKPLKDHKRSLTGSLQKIAQKRLHIAKQIGTLCVLALCLLPQTSQAYDCGVYGHVYPIAEQDFLAFIQHRLQTMKADGQLKAAQQDFIKRAKRHVLTPMPVTGLTTTQHPRTFYYDPTFTLKHNIDNANGHLLFAKGLTVNPLKRVPFNEVWLFLNGDDARQVAWARSELNKRAANNQLIKPILVKGNIKQTLKALKHRVYFDQAGVLTRKFKLRHIPCVVTQAANFGHHADQLKIQEINISAWGPHA